MNALFNSERCVCERRLSIATPDLGLQSGRIPRVYIVRWAESQSLFWPQLAPERRGIEAMGVLQHSLPRVRLKLSCPQRICHKYPLGTSDNEHCAFRRPGRIRYVNTFGGMNSICVGFFLHITNVVLIKNAICTYIWEFTDNYRNFRVLKGFPISCSTLEYPRPWRVLRYNVGVWINGSKCLVSVSVLDISKSHVSIQGLHSTTISRGVTNEIVPCWSELACRTDAFSFCGGIKSLFVCPFKGTNCSLGTQKVLFVCSVDQQQTFDEHFLIRSCKTTK